MAVMIATYVKKGVTERADAKETVRYTQHRPGKDNERASRALFGIDGVMERHHAYQLIDEAPKGRYFYRIIINPDPKKEDSQRDLPLRELIAVTMQTLANRRGMAIPWVAAVHDDHSDKRHIHALAVVKGRLNLDDLTALRQAATEEAQLQRHSRDLILEATKRQRELEEAAWER
jgi:hypothetical protein